MKRQGNLIEPIYELENLHLAFCKASRGKQHRQEIIRFRKKLQANLLRLQDDLHTGTLKPGAYRFFTVYDPKVRKICAAPFRDRVAHHSIMNVLEPVFERYAIYDSYACRKHKGLHKAVKRAGYFSRRYA